MNKSASKFKLGKASICLLFLCVVCALDSFGNETSAKPVASITINQGTASPTDASVGQEIEFSAQYSATAPGEEYALYVCKSKKMSSDQFCQDGSWCVSSSFTADNPLKCKYTTGRQDKISNNYFMFVCDKQKQCSSAFPGAFTVGTQSVLSLQVPEKIDFKSVPFSFSSQKSIGNGSGSLILNSINKSSPGWSLDVTAADWQDSSDGDTMDFDGDGKTTGQLTVDLSAMTIESPDSMSGIVQGKTASFTTGVNAINIATAGRKNGNGTFTIKNIKFDQFIPGNQKESTYKTMLTFTIS